MGSEEGLQVCHLRYTLPQATSEAEQALQETTTLSDGHQLGSRLCAPHTELGVLKLYCYMTLEWEHFDWSLSSDAQPRLACMLCLQAEYGKALLVLGTVCSTWVAVNSGTSGRTAATPDGCLEVPSVVAANQMVARTLHCN